MEFYGNAVRLTDYLGSRYRNEGLTYFLVSDLDEYGHLEVEETSHGLQIKFLVISPEFRGLGLCFRAFMSLAELSDHFECPLFVCFTPLPMSGCEVSLSYLETMGFSVCSWDSFVVVRKPASRRYFSEIRGVA